MTSTKTIHFVDQDSNESGFFLLRRATSAVGLCLSLENNGDIEVFISVTECKQLISILEELVSELQVTDSHVDALNEYDV